MVLQSVIDKIIAKINRVSHNKHITHIYGGATYMALHDRFERYQNQDNIFRDLRFENLKIVLLYETKSWDNIREAYKIMTNYLDERFDNNVILNENMTILHEQIKDMQRFIIKLTHLS